MGVLPASGAELHDVVAALGELRFPVVDTLPDGVLLVEPEVPSDSLQEAFTRARTLRDQRPTLFENAGPLARFPGSRGPITLTDQIIVRFRTGVTDTQIDSIRVTHRLERLANSPFDPRLLLFRSTPESQEDPLELTRILHESVLTEWAYPDWLSGTDPAVGDHPAAMPDSGSPPPPAGWPNDPFLSSQWHLKNGATGTGDINVEPVWNGLTKGDPSVVIAVVEVTGFEVTHPDLKNKLWSNPGEAGGNAGVDDDGNTLTDDIHGWNFTPCINSSLGCENSDLEVGILEHGTAVAGLAAAETDNSIGVAGVCPECRLMLLVTGAGQWGKLEAILYAQAMDASVINASWSMSFVSPLFWVILDATKDGRGGRGLPFVNAAGNDPFDVCQGTWRTFASMKEVISVSSSDNQEVRIPATGFGSCLTLMAPGGFDGKAMGVTSTDAVGNPGYNFLHAPSSSLCSRTELSDVDYTACFGGTSAATPSVSGVVGLMLSINPTLTRADIQDLLEVTAKKINCASAQYGGLSACPTDPHAHSDTYGYGLVNALDAVQAAKNALPTGAGGGGPSSSVSGPPKVELGARAGWTDLSAGSGGQDSDVTNAPGGGPAGEPVFYLALFSGGGAGGSLPSLMWELQFGSTRTSLSNPPSDESHHVAAVQASYMVTLGAGAVFAGPNFAVEKVSPAGGTSTSSHAFGAAVGYRFTPLPYLALRLEGHYRKWSGGGPKETGVALGFGVVIR